MAVVKPFEVEKQFKSVVDSAIETIKKVFPIEGKVHTLRLKNVWAEDKLDPHDLPSQKDAKLNGKSWAVPILSAMELIDNKTGKVVDSTRRMRLFDLPKSTPRASYIVEGNEYQVVNQLRLKPGVYTRVKNNGELESKVNLAKGVNFDIILNQERGVFVLKIGTSHIKLYPIMLDLGISKAKLISAWGSALVASNEKASAGVATTEINKLRAALYRRKPPASRSEAVDDVKEYLSGTKIDPETTKMTMGKSFTVADSSLILAASKRLLETARGEKPADDRDSLVFKSLHSVEDFVSERLVLNEEAIRRSVLNKLDRRFKVSEIISKKTFDDPVKTLFTQTSLSSTPEQTNPLHMYSGSMKLTIMGEGGIQSEQAVSVGARQVHPSEIGFVDPVQTPQSSMVGAVTRLALGSVKDGNKIKTQVWNVRTNKLMVISPLEFEKSVVAFPDQYVTVNKKVKPKFKKIKVMLPGNKIGSVSPSKVDYMIVDSMGMFSFSTNLVPFLNSTQGNRALMAAGQYEQALGLKYREKPLVQVDGGREMTVEEAVGKDLAHMSPVNGTITKIEDEYIHVKGKDGKSHKVGLYKDFPLNQKTFLSAEPIVAVGDKVKKDQVIADNNYTKDGVLSMGVNLKAAYLPYKGYNFEDGIVISETAAKKLTSEHMHKISIQISEFGLIDKKKFMAYFPAAIKSSNAAKLDDQGVIREGETVDMGDVLATYMVKSMQTPERMAIQKLHRSLMRPYTDRHEEWKYDFRGTVSKVVKTAKEINIYIKTEEPATIGDKLSGRYGNKGIISMILPDGEMPHTENDTPIEIALNPIGIPSRLNPSQVLETVASKVADKTGDIFTVRNFGNESNYDAVMRAMKDAGVKDKETLIDPEDGKPLGAPVMVGKQFITKLDHPVRKKFSARSRGAYTVDMQPASSSGESGQSMDHLTMYGMLAHGARENMREMATYKNEKNDEFWRALQLGTPLPPPKPTFAFDKFTEMMRASGVNIEKNGNNISLIPMTDKSVKDLSSGQVKNSLMLKAKDLSPEKGGLFDPTITGGLDGSNWSHIELNEPLPNPVFENAIKTMLNIKQAVYDDILAGKLYVDVNGNVNDKKDGSTGGAAIKFMLSKINIDGRLKELNALAATAKKNQLDKFNKEIRYLKALKKNGVKPQEYVVSKIPVIPPKFRPVYPMPDGSLNTSDANFLYKDIGLINDKLEDLKDLSDEEKSDLRKDSYSSYKALVGLGNPITYKEYRGFIELIKGRTQPKAGFYQKKLVRRRQDMTGRSTIVPEPKLGVDEVGLPKKMIWKIYEPHIVRELVQRGYTPLDAQKQVEEQSPAAQKAMEVATGKRPILLNRAPSLHKFSIMAFKPQVSAGKTIKIHPLVVKGFNADFDGDNMTVHVPATEKARVEAFQMLPTNNIFDPSSGSVMLAPINEMILGLYSLTKAGTSLKKRFKGIDEAKEALDKGEIKTNSLVTIAGEKTSLGRALVNEVLPAPLRSPTIYLDKKNLNALLAKIGKDHKNEFGKTVDALKNLGNKQAFKTGFTVGMEDIAPLKGVREMVDRAAKVKIGPRGSDKKKVKTYGQATDALDKALEAETGRRDTAFYHMATSGAKGSWEQLRQIIAAPMLLPDHVGEIQPTPVMKSYAEGLDNAGYWSTMYGARGGTIGKSLQTSIPGYFQKRLTGAVMGSTITQEDCGTNNGVDLPPDSRDVLGRYLASGNSPVARKNEMVDTQLVSKAKAAEMTALKVRSPLTCEASQGMCSMCFGKTEEGDALNVGDNVGALAATSLSEPLVQMAMNAFHTGGVAGSAEGGAALAQGYDRIAQLLEMPEIVKGKATLASVAGKVDKIEKNPAGGTFVWVDGNRHFVPQGRTVTVKSDQKVGMGDYLSDGVAKPQELLEFKGVGATRDYIADGLQRAYSKPIKRNFFEAVAKEMTNLTHVINPGSNNNFDFGDYAPLNKIEDINKKGGDIAHQPVLKGINTLPLMSEDWMARMATRDLAKTIREGASRGWSSDIHGTHPIPAYVYGAEFGTGTEGKY